jgi:hypothetical protein
MEPDRAERILDEWSSVARSATPPGPPPRGATTSVTGAGISLAGAAVLVVALVAVFAVLNNRPDQTAPGALPSTSPSPSVAFASPSPSVAVAIPAPPTPTPSASPAPTAAPSGSPALAACDGSSLSARITSWEGAAGSRIANVRLTNAGAAPCATTAVARARLVDGGGTELIQGAQPSGGATITIPAGASVTTLVQVSNYCGAAPVAPVGIAFDINGVATVLAKPASNTDATVPPCNGPGQPGTIEMHPWSAT